MNEEKINPILKNYKPDYIHYGHIIFICKKCGYMEEFGYFTDQKCPNCHELLPKKKKKNGKAGLNKWM